MNSKPERAFEQVCRPHHSSRVNWATASRRRDREPGQQQGAPHRRNQEDCPGARGPVGVGALQQAGSGRRARLQAGLIRANTRHVELAGRGPAGHGCHLAMRMGQPSTSPSNSAVTKCETGGVFPAQSRAPQGGRACAVAIEHQSPGRSGRQPTLSKPEWSRRRNTMKPAHSSTRHGSETSNSGKFLHPRVEPILARASTPGLAPCSGVPAAVKEGHQADRGAALQQAGDGHAGQQGQQRLLRYAENMAANGLPSPAQRRGQSYGWPHAAVRWPAGEG
ncbi:hypothetical protein FQR65_LT20546 [Abscondita terminalis]|nr:hypothetical protein FQR65_LT20546 [Abscondita terminalis]